MAKNKSIRSNRKRELSLLGRNIRKHYGLYLLVLLPIAYLILFKYIPMYGAQIAFRNYQPAKGIWESPWVGLRYIRQFVNNYMFVRLLRNTLMISIYSLATFPLPLILAVLLNYVSSGKFRKSVQMVSYAPHFISTVVMAGMIIQFLDVRSGPVNGLISLLGAGPINFMAQPAYFYHIYIWSGVWQNIGYSSIIYIAALTSVPVELHEAAIVDGASILKRIRHIDIPSILPMVCILLILQCGSILNVGFEKVFLLQNNLNGEVSEIISTYVYKQGIASSLPNYSYSTAIGLFVAVINFILLFSMNHLSKRASGNSLW